MVLSHSTVVGFIDSSVDEEIAEKNSLEPVTATKRMTLGFTDSSKNAKETNVELTLTIQEYRVDSRLVFRGYARVIEVKDIEIGP